MFLITAILNEHHTNDPARMLHVYRIEITNCQSADVVIYLMDALLTPYTSIIYSLQ